jgi:predicted kinase
MIEKYSQKPILFATLGLPGAGKTTFARKFSKEFNLLHLNSDRIRRALFVKPKYTKVEHDLVFPAMDALAEDALKNGISVLYDANSTKRAYRKNMIQTAKKYHTQFFLLYFDIPVAAAKKRLDIRRRCTSRVCRDYHPPLPMKDFVRLKGVLEEPTAKEPTIYIHGTDTYARQKNTVLTSLSSRA